jgi:hypothetical protein
MLRLVQDGTALRRMFFTGVQTIRPELFLQRVFTGGPVSFLLTKQGFFITPTHAATACIPR